MVLAGCDAPLIPGRDTTDIFSFDLPTTPPTILRWSVGTTIRVYAADAASPEGTTLLRSALDQAARAWNATALFSEFHIAPVADPADADVLLAFSDVTLPVETDGCVPVLTLAVTTFCIDGLGTPTASLHVFPLRGANDPGHIRMVVLVLSAGPGDAAVIDRLVAHEMGHVLGIGRHSEDARDLMYRIDQVTARPGARDAATVQVLYHTRADIEIR